MNAPTAYYDEKHRVVAVIHGLSDKWISARGRHRVKSPSLPPRDTQEEAQADLDAYADGKGWEIVPCDGYIQEVADTNVNGSESGSLTAIEHKSFAECEQVIAKGMHTFVEVGNALLAIRDGKLYRDQYATFEAYCSERWEISSNYAKRLVRSSEVVRQLKTVPIGTVLPATESQARPLTSIPMEQVNDVWQDAVDTAPKAEDGRPIITARHVQETVDRWKEADEPYVEPTGFDSQAEGLKVFAWVRKRAAEWPREYARELSGILSQLAQEVLE